MAGKSVFKYPSRKGWRATVRLKSGKVKTKDFRLQSEAKAWADDIAAKDDSDNQPWVGGPEKARLADVMGAYAEVFSVGKAAPEAELNRIGHYLRAAGLPIFRLARDGDGKATLVSQSLSTIESSVPKGVRNYLDQRRSTSQRTYEAIAALARKRCSDISGIDITNLVTTMKADKLSDSTVQKEIALVRHVFNCAINFGRWTNFVNPCAKIKLKTPAPKVVWLTAEQALRLRESIAEADPLFRVLAEVAIATTARQSSLLALTWDAVNLDGRLLFVANKNRPTTIPLSLNAVEFLRRVPRSEGDRVFPFTPNAVRKAWDHVRARAGLSLTWRDLRHVGATAYASLGAHALQQILGHSSPRMAQVYVNLQRTDVLKAMDEIDQRRTRPEVELPPVPVAPAAELSAAYKTNRIYGLQPRKKGHVYSPHSRLLKKNLSAAANQVVEDDCGSSSGESI